MVRFQNNFTWVFLPSPSTKIAKTVPLLPNKMAARAKNRNIFKRYLLLSQWPDFKIISHECSYYHPLPKLLKRFRSTRTRWPLELKIEISLNTISSLASAWFQNNFTWVFLLSTSTKIAKMVPLHQTRWPPELEISLGNNLNYAWFQNL